MTRREILAAFGVACAGLVVGACSRRPKPVRYKMTVEVDTPEGVRSGSAVREVTTRVQHSAESVFTTFKVHGEAVAVDLPNGRTLFALLRGGPHSGDEDYAG